jgi:hypothetical protein
MRPITYYVSRVGDHWEVRCRTDPDDTLYRERSDAVTAACRAAERLWAQQQVASEVRVDDEDGRWLLAGSFGELLGFG